MAVTYTLFACRTHRLLLPRKAAMGWPRGGRSAYNLELGIEDPGERHVPSRKKNYQPGKFGSLLEWPWMLRAIRRGLTLSGDPREDPTTVPRTDHHSDGPNVPEHADIPGEGGGYTQLNPNRTARRALNLRRGGEAGRAAGTSPCTKNHSKVTTGGDPLRPFALQWCRQHPPDNFLECLDAMSERSIVRRSSRSAPTSPTLRIAPISRPRRIDAKARPGNVAGFFVWTCGFLGCLFGVCRPTQ